MLKESNKIQEQSMQLRHGAIQKKLRYMFRQQNTSLMLMNYITLLI
jgi:hypothetical protein